ncbi:unnamed protein product [Rhizophagus irregularis]|nr:unnamed protein product [Rhizophagus irregularis]
MAGKTTLAQLFENSLLNSDEVKKGLRRVFRISLMGMDNKEDDEWTFAEGFKSLMNMTLFEFLNSCNVETFLITLQLMEVNFFMAVMCFGNHLKMCNDT